MNPITYARITAGLSKQALSKKLGVSRTYIIRAEQACYVNPGTKLVDFSCGALGVSHEEFKRKYKNFQVEQRALAVLNLEKLEVKNRLRAEDPEETPKRKLYYHEVFKVWREGYWNSPIVFSSSLCFHPDSVSNYEQGEYNSMPIVMARVLKDLGLIDSSFDVYSRWCYVRT